MWHLVAVVLLAQRDHDVGRIINAYKPHRLHPGLFDGRAGWQQWIHPPLLAAIRQGQLTGSRSEIDKLLRNETDGVYSFQILSDEFCDFFLEELDHYYETGLPVYRPNSMVTLPCRDTHTTHRPLAFPVPSASLPRVSPPDRTTMASLSITSA